jgi:hypothetical protein
VSAGAGGRVRLAVLATATALAAAIAVAWKERPRPAPSTLPQPAGPVHTALVAPLPAAAAGRDRCGVPLGRTTEGLRHAQLPCGVKIYLEYRGATVLTEVVDQGPTGGDAFQLTAALAALLHIHGQAAIRWQFAR